MISDLARPRSETYTGAVDVATAQQPKFGKVKALLT
jgi:hypothetical protein